MAAKGKGPFAGAPQEKASLNNCPAIQAEIKSMAPPPGCFWIEEPDRQIVRTAINRAIAGEGRLDVHIQVELDEEAATKGWTAIRVEAGRWRYLVGIHGWTPGVKDIRQILTMLEPAGDPIEEVRELSRDLANARQARSLLTDGRALAARALAKASHTIWRAFGDVFQEASNPSNWASSIPAEAQIEGLWYAVKELEESGSGE